MGERFSLFHPARTPTERVLTRLTAGCALLVPAATGALVKLQLDSTGKPTRTWIDGATGILVITAAAGVGWVLLVLPLRYGLWRFGSDARRERGLVWAWSAALIGASLGLAALLYDLLQVAAIAAMVAVLAPWLYWGATLGGGLVAGVAGYWLGARSRNRGR